MRRFKFLLLNEHAVISSNQVPWWQRYQPVSYSLENSRSGTIAELEDMITRCNAVGVDIYADAVINHMTAGDNTGSNGSVVSKIIIQKSHMVL